MITEFTVSVYKIVITISDFIKTYNRRYCCPLYQCQISITDGE